MNALCKGLCKAGSTEAYALQVGADAAAQAMHELTLQTPAELQPIWPYVLQWNRIQLAYERADELGDTKGMLDASNASAKLLRDVY